MGSQVCVSKSCGSRRIHVDTGKFRPVGWVLVSALKSAMPFETWSSLRGTAGGIASSVKEER